MIAVAVTLEGDWTVKRMLQLTQREVDALRDRMPREAWRWARDWSAYRGTRVFCESVIRASKRTCGYGLGALLRASWSG